MLDVEEERIKSALEIALTSKRAELMSLDEINDFWVFTVLLWLTRAPVKELLALKVKDFRIDCWTPEHEYGFLIAGNYKIPFWKFGLAKYVGVFAWNQNFRFKREGSERIFKTLDAEKISFLFQKFWGITPECFFKAQL